jgi:hypothetical protein
MAEHTKTTGDVKFYRENDILPRRGACRRKHLEDLSKSLG